MQRYENHGNTSHKEIILSRTLITAPNILLDEDSDPIEKFDKKLVELANDMKHIMLRHKGMGLAAIQIGVPKRIITVDTTEIKKYMPNEEAFIGALVNPEFVPIGTEKHTMEEGCLSFPGARITIRRPLHIKVKYQNLRGQPTEREFKGVLAQCIQHEIDHLNGITFYKRRQMGDTQKVIEKI